MIQEVDRQKAKELIAETILINSECDLPELKMDFPYFDYTEEIQNLLLGGKLKGLSKKALMIRKR
ncbi:MAG: hypothetical protein KTR26_04625 [Flammeovirgaceae bacterium]|nr:hypothetical protein [Flammeovirgaceae bacterium]